MKTPRKASPARSQGAVRTPIRHRHRRTLSVSSARSNASGFLSALAHKKNNNASFVISPLPNRKSVLTDDTQIDEPRRKSWWKNLGENSRNVIELLEDDQNAEPNNIIEELDMEILSQENKQHHTFELPESSDNESINSIVLPQRKLFTQKENQNQKLFSEIVGPRETLAKLHKTGFDKTLVTGTRALFQNKPKSKPIFPAVLLNISPNKTLADKTKELAAAEPKAQVRNIFGNRGSKRKNIFSNFIVTESEDEISEIQPKIFGFQKKFDGRRRSSSRGAREYSPASSITTDMEMDDWKMLPSSTMVENQLEALMGAQSPKRARLSKLSEIGSEAVSNSTKQSNKSNTSKDKSRKSKTFTKEKAQDQEEILENNETKSRKSKTFTKEKALETTGPDALPINNDVNKDIAESRKSKTFIQEKVSETDGENLVADIVVANKSRKSKTFTKEKSFESESMTTRNKSKSMIVGNDEQNKTLITDKSRKSKTFVKERGELETSMTTRNKSKLAEDNAALNKSLTLNPKNNISMKPKRLTTNSSHHNSTNQNKSSSKENDNVEENPEYQDNDDEMNFSLKYDNDEEDEIENENMHLHNKVVEDSPETKVSQENSRTLKTINKSLVKNTSKLNVSITNKKNADLSPNQTMNNDDEVDNMQDNSKNKSNLKESKHHEIVTVTDIIDQNLCETSRPEVDANDVVDQIASEAEQDVIQEQRDYENEQFKPQDQESENEQNKSKIETDIHEESVKEQNDNEPELYESKAEENESGHKLNKSEVEENVNEPEETESEVEKNNVSEAEQNESKIQNDSEVHEESEAEQNESQVEMENEESEAEQNESQVEMENEESEAEQNESQVEMENEEEKDEQNESQVETENEEEDEQNESQVETEKEEEDEQNESQVEAEDEEEEVDQESEAEQNESSLQNNEDNESDNEEDSVGSGVENDDNPDSGQDNDVDNDHQDSAPEEIMETPNVSHDTTGRNRHKTNPKSPEAMLHDSNNINDSYYSVKGNKDARKTEMLKSMHRDLVPAKERDSTGFADGTDNSSGQGSGWDSHRTTRKTLRMTYGQDITPRKSLRALVMEKSAKRQTLRNELASVTAASPLANSTEMPSTRFDDDDIENETPNEISFRTRQTTLEKYLMNVKQKNSEKRSKIEEEVLNSLKAPSKTHIFKVPMKPLFARKAAPKPKQADPKANARSKQLFGELPKEFIEDLKYKPPKRFQPRDAPWITKHLYKFLEEKLEPKYHYRARVRAEKLVESVYNFARDLRRRDVAARDAVDLLKREMARLEVVRTHFDFYEFFHQFMPREVRVKVIPDVINKISLPRQGIFGDII